MSKPLIIPTVFAKDALTFKHRLDKLRKVSHYIHLDFMDGMFVQAKSVEVSALPDLHKYNNIFEAHLMTMRPSKYLKQLKRIGIKKVIFHYESCGSDRECFAILKETRLKKMKVFIALNPRTPVRLVFPFMHSIQGIFFMGHAPGREHLRFVHSVLDKIRFFHDKYPKIPIQVDGGVEPAIISVLHGVGVSIFNAGSYVAEALNSAKALEELGKTARR